MSLVNRHKSPLNSLPIKLVLSIIRSHTVPGCFPHSSVDSALVWVLQTGQGRWKLSSCAAGRHWPGPCFILVLANDVISRCPFFNQKRCTRIAYSESVVR